MVGDGEKAQNRGAKQNPNPSVFKIMLQDLRKIIGCKLGASDGEIGNVKDFYFDDRTWMVRYLVADTGNWLPGRQVLLAPPAFGQVPFGRLEESQGVLRVELSRQRIEDSPSIDTALPVSRQNEAAYYQHYGWPMYWSADPMTGAGATVPVAIAPPMTTFLGTPDRQEARGDVHLRSVLAVVGYALHATDGELGKVVGFVVNNRTWQIQEMVVEAGHWYSGKEIRILPENVTRISYDKSAVYVNFAKCDIENTVKNDVVEPGL